MSLNTILPKPTFSVHDREYNGQLPSLPLVKIGPPPYGYRKGWVPRNLEDYGDGGAFPEIAVAQYPLNMGYKSISSKCLQLQVDHTGKPKYDALVRQGVNKSKIVYSNFTDLLPKEITEDDAQYARPDEEVVKNATEKTRQALEKLVASKISAAMPVQHAPKQAPAQFIRYMPSQQGLVQSSGPKQRIIRMVQAQKDPMEPPRFKINKKIPRAPPSPPVPVLHSPTRKVTVKEQQEWKIPPCISNWKNAKGYTIPLDKRLAADGRGLQSVHINEGFAKLAEALYVADRQAREAIELRAQLERKLAQKEKDKKEEGLRKLAEHARAVRAGVNLKSIDDDEFIEREEIRRERQKERQRERGIQRAAPEKRSKLLKERERDITEKIALGLPNAGSSGGELQYDVRLLNLSKGLDSGFADDEAYNVYDKPWREENAVANTLYRPSKNIDKELYGDDIEKIANIRRFVPDRGFDKATEGNVEQTRDGPVQFEKHTSKPDEEEEDPFGLGQFFEQVKKTTRKTSAADGPVNKKRRKD